MEISKWEDKIFSANYYNFETIALELFQLQYQFNQTYKTYVDNLGIVHQNVNQIENIPFLPIQFFKNNAVKTTEFDAEVIFESSGTTGENVSRHFVRNLNLYKKSFSRGFRAVYGEPADWCILGLLPGYLERKNSSLIYMVNDLIAESRIANSNFYLYDHDKLYQVLVQNEIKQQPSLLIGVTFALLDFAEQHSIKLKYTTVMETGGMKGRKEEMTREEVHGFLQEKLGLTDIHSEYGMTELLSQAYSKKDGLYNCPPWMKVLVREENDPLAVTAKPPTKKASNGLLNIIDFANLYSCSFIATDDVGKLYQNGSFEVLGRRDLSDLRGCSLLTVNP